jgi:flavodoxin
VISTFPEIPLLTGDRKRQLYVIDITKEISMMKIAVIYDSMFGNTERIAHAVSNALNGSSQVRTVKAAEAGPEELKGVNLVILGSPTHRGKPTDNFKTFLESINRKSLQGVQFAVFDTRYRMSKILLVLYGSAAGKLERQMKKLGGSPVLPTESFIVQGREGPLEDSESSRAAFWAEALLEKMRGSLTKLQTKV